MGGGVLPVTGEPEVLNFLFFKMGPEIVGLGGLSGPLLPGNLSENGGGRSPPPFLIGFAAGKARPPKMNDLRPGTFIA